MARALPVFFTMMMTWMFRWGKTLSPLAIVGMLIIFIGCICMSFTGGDDKLSLREKFISMRKGLLGILIAAVGTTGYTISDSFGIKNIMAFAGDRNTFLVAASYSSCREIVTTITLWVIVLICYCCKWARGLFKNLVKSKHPYMAGFSAALAYLLVLVAMFYVTNVSFVQAFRQLSLPVSAALGFIFLKEKISVLRLVSLAMIMSGLIICVI
jgi:drug/metabolite transporter (DMT)-like permease